MGNSYDLVARTLDGRESRKVANNSYLCYTQGKRDREEYNGGQPGTIAYRLHGTYVVLYHDNGVVELNTGGWRTVTTKDRINRCFNDYGPSGYRVYSDRGVWYLYLNGQKVAGFADGMFIHEDGTITGDEDVELKHESNDKLSKLVKAYLRGLTPEKVVEVMQDNGTGDCLFCSFAFGGAKVSGGTHLWDHLEEKYYMPTLFWSAICAARHGDPALVWAIILSDAQGSARRAPEVSTFLTRDLSRYFRGQLRQA